jgi:hypothetical protein
VNHLLKYALEQERKANLARESALFFADMPRNHEERRAFQKAGVNSWARE